MYLVSLFLAGINYDIEPPVLFYFIIEVIKLRY